MAKLKGFSILFILFLLFSCNKENESHYYENGNLKSTSEINSSGEKDGVEKLFYLTGKLKSIGYFKKGVPIDSTIIYNPDSSLKSVIYQGKKKLVKNYKGKYLYSTGHVDSKNRPIGWWKFYDKNAITYEEERIIVMGKSISNQIKKFTSQRKLDTESSKFYEMTISEEILVGKPYPITITFSFDTDAQTENLLGKEYFYLLTSPDIKEEFSNVNKIKLDTIYQAKRNDFFLTVGYRSAGRKFFRGIIERHTMVKENEQLFVVKSQMFVDKELLVL